MEIQKLNTKLKNAEEREVKLMSEHARMLDENQIDLRKAKESDKRWRLKVK